MRRNYYIYTQRVGNGSCFIPWTTDLNMFIMFIHRRYCICWWPGEARRQCVFSHGIHPVPPKVSSLSIRKVTLFMFRLTFSLYVSGFSVQVATHRHLRCFWFARWFGIRYGNHIINIRWIQLQFRLWKHNVSLCQVKSHYHISAHS